MTNTLTATRTTKITIPADSPYAKMPTEDLELHDEGLASAEKSWRVLSNSDKGHAKAHWSVDLDKHTSHGSITLVGGKAKMAFDSGKMNKKQLREKFNRILAMREAIKAELASRKA